MSRWHRRLGWACVGLIILGVSAGGCARRDANQALEASKQAIDGLPAEVQQFLAVEYEQVQKVYDEAREDLAAGKFKDAIAKAQQATAQAESLTVRVEARRVEFMQEWGALEAALPGALTALAARIEEATKKLPAGVTAEVLADAKSELERLPRQWAQASSLAQGGQLVDAVLIGRKLKAECEQLMTALGMPGAGAAPSGAAANAPAAGSTP